MTTVVMATAGATRSINIGIPAPWFVEKLRWMCRMWVQLLLLVLLLYAHSQSTLATVGNLTALPNGRIQ